MPEISNEELKKLREALDLYNSRSKDMIILSKEEIAKIRELIKSEKDINQLVSDKKAVTRAWSILKTGLMAMAGTIVAWQVIINQGISGILRFLGVDVQGD